jgi:ATP-binding cassette, subfamily B, bacterial
MTILSLTEPVIARRARRHSVSALGQFAWPLARLGDAIEALASVRGLAPRPVEVSAPPAHLERDDQQIGAWIEAAADWLGIEAEPVEASYSNIRQLVGGTDPMLLRLPCDGAPTFLAIVGRTRQAVSVLAPDLTIHRLRPERICTALCHDLETPLMAEVDRMLKSVGVPVSRQAQARSAILRQRLGMAQIAGCWCLRSAPSASFWLHARQRHLPRIALSFMGMYTIQYVLWQICLWIIARGALSGRLDLGWVLAWALLLITIIPFRLVGAWSHGQLITGIGSLLKQRIMYGILRLAPEEIRHQGIGQLIGRAFELEAVEAFVAHGGLLGLVAGIELAVAAIVLSNGAGGMFHTLLLLVWLVMSLAIGWRSFLRRQRWTAARLEMTHDLVEQMVGHRTRLAYELRERWHAGEDQALARYLELSRAMDRSSTLLLSLLPRGWLVVGLIGLAAPFVSGQAAPVELALSLGGILGGYQALRKLGLGIWNIGGAAIAWKQVGPIFHAAAHAEIANSPAFALSPTAGADRAKEGDVLIDARELLFRYANRDEPVLQRCDLQIRASDRLLLEGPSGGGKSTLAALLSGRRSATSGLLLLHGLDRPTLGAAGWRRRVVAAPQFHENHVFSETFAFNLLMGRRWPPQLEDVAEAETVCQELGLGDLINRMPAGMLQMVGETGWQLSHGEKSRLYIARSLLQDADLVILDESFAALDPETLQLALGCALRRAKTLLVIAHP